MKTYYRDEHGAFITRQQFFAAEPKTCLRTSSDLNHAAKIQTEIEAQAPRARTLAVLAILDATKITEYGGQRDTLQIDTQASGHVIIWYSTGTTGGSAEQILERVLADIARLVALQTQYAAAAQADSVEF